MLNTITALHVRSLNNQHSQWLSVLAQNLRFAFPLLGLSL